MNLIRQPRGTDADLVRLKYSPSWVGRVLCIEADDAFVLRMPECVTAWMPLEFLELAPGNEEEMLA